MHLASLLCWLGVHRWTVAVWLNNENGWCRKCRNCAKVGKLAAPAF